MKFFLTILFPLSVLAENIKKDTSMSGVWDLKGRVLNISAKISGNVTIWNAKIEASPYIQIFDTTVSLINCRTREFSTAWYGAKPGIKDNSAQLQKAIRTAIDNAIPNLYCADSYSYSQSLIAYTIYKGQYVGFAINFYGDGDRWNQRQTLTYTGNSFGYGVQVAKGGSFRGITLIGNSKGNGVVIDYDGSKNKSGSTGFFIEDCFVSNFDINYYISPAGTFNGDIIHLNNVHSGKCRIGFVSAQPQNKGIVIDGFYSWDSSQVLIEVISGNCNVSNVQVAGYTEQLFYVQINGWNTFSVTNLYAESVKSLGTILAYNTVYLPPVNLSNMDIRFTAGSQKLFTTNSPKVKISNSALWFYNGQCCQQMNFSGPFIWDNNDCGSCDIVDPDIQYIYPSRLNPVTIR